MNDGQRYLTAATFDFSKAYRDYLRYSGLTEKGKKDAELIINDFISWMGYSVEEPAQVELKRVAAAQAKLARYAQAEREMPEEPDRGKLSESDYRVEYDKYVQSLRDHAIAQQVRVNSLQAKLDALMLEFCPNEMTPEQVAKWGRHQVESKK